MHNSWVKFRFSLHPKYQSFYNSNAQVMVSNTLAGIQEMLNDNCLRFSKEPINRPEADPYKSRPK